MMRGMTKAAARKRAQTLKRRRDYLGLTQAQLAELAEVAVRTIQNLESPLPWTPSVEVKTKVLAALQIPYSQQAEIFLGEKP